MISIAGVVQELISVDFIHLETLRGGTLNLHAYAQIIRPKVERLAKKTVQIGSIVTALSRLSKNLAVITSVKPEVEIESLSVKSGLVVVNYEKTGQLLAALAKGNLMTNEKDFFVLTEGQAEVAIVASKHSMVAIEKKIALPTKSKFTNAVAIILRFNESYIIIPNVLYAFVSALAAKRINLLEIISTLTEVSFIIESKDMDDAVMIFKGFLPT